MRSYGGQAPRTFGKNMPRLPQIIAALLVLSSGGCAHTSQSAVASLVGDFTAVGQADYWEINFAPDGSYQAFDFLTKRPLAVDGKQVAIAVDGFGPVDSGTWHLTKPGLVLTSDEAGRNARRFSITRERDRIVITEVGHPSQKYEKPNKASELTAPSGSGFLRR
jgi:hypothetical protein